MDIAIQPSGIAALTLGNLDAQNRAEVVERIEAVGREQDIRAIVLAGCASQGFYSASDAELDDDRWISGWHALFDAVRTCNKPLIAQTQGTITGAGLEIALLSDIRVADDAALLGCSAIISGSPSVLALWLLAERVGLSRAIDLVLTGRLISAQEAASWSLLQRVVPKQKLQQEVESVALALGAKSVIAMRLNKSRFRELTESAYRQALKTGLQAAAKARPR